MSTPDYEALAGDVAARAVYARKSGNFDRLHADLLAEVHALRMSRAEFADEAQRLRNWRDRLGDRTHDLLARARDRDDAIAERDRLRDGIEALVQAATLADGDDPIGWVVTDDLRTLLDQTANDGNTT